MKPPLLERFETLREQNVIALKEAKEAGQRVVGTYCLYSPTELIVAAGAIPVSLCGTRETPIPAAEQMLPRNLCPLIKSSYGFAVTDTCPYFHFADLLVAETTCDGKKKMYELLGELKPIHLMQLPQTQEGEFALSFWRSEVERLKTRLEQEFLVQINDDGLRSAIRLLNEERLAFRALQDLCRAKPSPISGMDLLTAMYNRGFCIDKRQSIDMLRSLTAELEEMADKGRSPFRIGTPRILLTGVPVGIGSEKVVRIVEERGGNIVCFESCGAYKKVALVDEEGDPLTAIARKYLATPCSCMSPNRGRLELVERLVREFGVGGVIDLTWQACHTYNVESILLQRHLERTVQIPFLHIETDYSENDSEQLRVRIEAFLEML